MNKLGQKLKECKGETMAEALVASFLAGIGLLILATMIRVSHRIIDKSNETINTFYKEVNQLEQQSINPKWGTVSIIGPEKSSEIKVKIYEAESSGLIMYTGDEASKYESD